MSETPQENHKGITIHYGSYVESHSLVKNNNNTLCIVKYTEAKGCIRI